MWNEYSDTLEFMERNAVYSLLANFDLEEKVTKVNKII